MLHLKLLGGATLLEDDSGQVGGAAGHRHSQGLMALLARASGRRGESWWASCGPPFPNRRRAIG